MCPGAKRIQLGAAKCPAVCESLAHFFVASLHLHTLSHSAKMSVCTCCEAVLNPFQVDWQFHFQAPLFTIFTNHLRMDVETYAQRFCLQVS